MKQELKKIVKVNFTKKNVIIFCISFIFFFSILLSVMLYGNADVKEEKKDIPDYNELERQVDENDTSETIPMEEMPDDNMERYKSDDIPEEDESLLHEEIPMLSLDDV